VISVQYGKVDLVDDGLAEYESFTRVREYRRERFPREVRAVDERQDPRDVDTQLITLSAVGRQEPRVFEVA
jgi:hypothetical protein